MTRGGGVFDPVAQACRRDPAAPALREEQGWTSYGDLSRELDAWSAALAAAGAAPSHRVAVVADASAVGIRGLHAVFRTGATVVPLHPSLTPAELAGAIEVLRPSVIVSEERYLEPVREAWAAATAPAIVALGPKGPTLRVAPGAPAPAVALPGVALLWTSGTASAPRAVLLTAAALVANAQGSAERLGLEASDRWLASLSPAHVGGLALLVRAAWLGAAVVPARKFDAAAFLTAVELGITHASLVPTHLRRLLDTMGGRRMPPGLGAVLVGGALAAPELVREALTCGLPVALTYGLTESTSQVATATPAEVEARPEWVGRPLTGVSVKLSEKGEILVRGPTVAAGRVRAGDGGLALEPVTDADGWLHTGDSGELDAAGHLRVVGRRSDRIITGGVSVDPSEVEAVLESHPRVAEAAVVGLPDPRWGECLVAALVPVAGTREPGADELAAFVRGRLSGPKRPKAYRMVPALPLNPNHKVDRGALRRLLERRLGRRDGKIPL